MHNPRTEKLVGFTTPVKADGYGYRRKEVCIQYTRLADGVMRLQPISEGDLENMPGMLLMSAVEFAARPRDPAYSAEETHWALNVCGWEPSPFDPAEDLRGTCCNHPN